MRWLVLCIALAAPLTATAHRLDEYLQAVLVVVEPGEIRLQINLTPGVAIAEQPLALMDPDRDATISADEAAAYAEQVRQDLLVHLDGQPVELKLTASAFSGVEEIRSGFGIVHLEFTVLPGAFPPGAHRFSLENRHLPNLSVHLFNAAKPRSNSVIINRQVRNDTQASGLIDFSFP